MAKVTERDIKAALDMEDAREKREEDDGFLGWNLHNRRKCRCWERRPGQQMCMGCERIMANAQFIADARAESEAARLKAEGELKAEQEVGRDRRVEAVAMYKRLEARLREVEGERDEARELVANNSLAHLTVRKNLEIKLGKAEARLRAVIEASKRVDFAQVICSECGLPWSQHGGRDGK